MNFQAFQQPLRDMAARNLGKRDPTKGARLTVGKTWAGMDALQILGETFGVTVNLFQGCTEGLYCVVGRLVSLREVNLLLRRGRWYGVRGSIPPRPGMTPLGSSAPDEWRALRRSRLQ